MRILRPMQKSPKSSLAGKTPPRARESDGQFAKLNELTGSDGNPILDIDGKPVKYF